jgi:hypothetical protein
MGNLLKTMKYGNCQVSVFENMVNVKGRDVSIKKATLSKRYKDGQEWKNTNSLDVNDIPKMIAALEETYKYLTKVDTDRSMREEIEVE